jgi:protein arginine kinase activator
MKCFYCEQVATIHLTDIVNTTKREMHLCDRCARQKKLIPDGPSPELNLSALVQIIMAQAADEMATTLECPDCGIGYAAFRADGRLGCPTDYDAFRTALEPLLERIHRSIHHDGKTPRSAVLRSELSRLREELNAAIAAESFERAAELRDLIRTKEGADESR